MAASAKMHGLKVLQQPRLPLVHPADIVGGFPDGAEVVEASPPRVQR